MKLNRRRFLTGAAGALSVPFALPLLPSLSAQAGEYPKRLVIWWVPEGVNQATWFPSGGGLSEGLAPLADFRDKISILKGLNNSAGGGGDVHETGPAAILTGGDGPDRNFGGIDAPSGRSMDRVVGRAIQGDAPFATYELGVRTHAIGTERMRRVSYDGRGGGRDAVTNPGRAFDDLLAGVGAGAMPGAAAAEARERRLAHQTSLLDSVRGDLRRLRCQVGVEGREKFDAHLDAIRSVETRLQGLSRPIEPGTTVPPVNVEGRHRDRGAFWNNSGRYREIASLQMEIARSALAAGSTNVLTFCLSHSVSRQTYSFIDGMNYPGETHHTLSHHRSDGRGDRALADQTRINKWHAGQLHNFLAMLEAVPEGDGTLLDNTLVLRISEMGDGNHGRDDIPFLIAGSGDRFRLGENLHAGGRSQNDLLAAILNGFDIPANGFGAERYSGGPYDAILR